MEELMQAILRYYAEQNNPTQSEDFYLGNTATAHSKTQGNVETHCRKTITCFSFQNYQPTLQAGECIEEAVSSCNGITELTGR